MVFTDYCIDLPVSDLALLFNYCRPIINAHSIFDLTTPILTGTTLPVSFFRLSSEAYTDLHCSPYPPPDVLVDGLVINLNTQCQLAPFRYLLWTVLHTKQALDHATHWGI